MNTTIFDIDQLKHRAYRLRREIAFAVMLTLMAFAYLLPPAPNIASKTASVASSGPMVIQAN